MEGLPAYSAAVPEFMVEDNTNVKGSGMSTLVMIRNNGDVERKIMEVQLSDEPSNNNALVKGVKIVQAGDH
jgi:hypothetical protein